MDSINELTDKPKEFIGLAEQIQLDTVPPDKQEQLLRELSNEYHTWYRNCLRVLGELNATDSLAKFESEYEGSFWTQKISKYLSSGLAPNPLYKNGEAILPGVTRWLYPTHLRFIEPLNKQINILSQVTHEEPMRLVKDSKEQSPLESRIIQAFHEAIGPLHKQLTILSQAKSEVWSTDSKEAEKWNPLISRIFQAFLDKANDARTNSEKKLTYEYLAIFIVGAIEGLSVLSHDRRGASEEIDVWVKNERTDPFWQTHVGDPFIIECKNWGKPIGVPELRDFRGKMTDRQVRFGILLSRNHVTGDQYRDAQSLIRETVKDGVYIVVLDENDLLRISWGIHPAEIIKEKFYALKMDKAYIY